MVLEIVVVVLVVVIVASIAGYWYGKQTRGDLSVLTRLGEQLGEIKGSLEAIMKQREEERKEERYYLDSILKAVIQYQKTMVGAHTRGEGGEQLLKEYLAEFIKMGLVETKVSLGEGYVVEFAWKLNDGKYLPIDSKFPDVSHDMEKLENETDIEKQRDIKKGIARKVDSAIEQTKKYQNLPRTTRTVIVALPQPVIDLVPEKVGKYLTQNVVVCSYANAPIIAFLIAENYHQTLRREEQKLYEIVKQLVAIIENIEKNTETIIRGVRMIENAQESIASEIRKAKQIQREGAKEFTQDEMKNEGKDSAL